MKILSAIAGAVLGLMLASPIVLAGVALGLPLGPGWWLVLGPFMLVIAYLAAIQK